jgi:hypothetical protein
VLAREAYKTAKLFGFNENMALLSADNYCKNTLGTRCPWPTWALRT